jgi:hypothetical protein
MSRKSHLHELILGSPFKSKGVYQPRYRAFVRVQVRELLLDEILLLSFRDMSSRPINKIKAIPVDGVIDSSFATAIETAPKIAIRHAIKGELSAPIWCVPPKSRAQVRLTSPKLGHSRSAGIIYALAALLPLVRWLPSGLITIPLFPGELRSDTVIQRLLGCGPKHLPQIARASRHRRKLVRCAK